MTRRPVVHLPIYHEGCGFAGLASVELADGSWSPYLCSYCDREAIAAQGLTWDQRMGVAYQDGAEVLAQRVQELERERDAARRLADRLAYDLRRVTGDCAGCSPHDCATAALLQECQGREMED